jgi:hypothetical protein
VSGYGDGNHSLDMVVVEAKTPCTHISSALPEHQGDRVVSVSN